MSTPAATSGVTSAPEPPELLASGPMELRHYSACVTRLTYTTDLSLRGHVLVPRDLAFEFGGSEIEVLLDLTGRLVVGSESADDAGLFRRSERIEVETARLEMTADGTNTVTADLVGVEATAAAMDLGGISDYVAEIDLLGTVITSELAAALLDSGGQLEVGAGSVFAGPHLLVALPDEPVAVGDTWKVEERESLLLDPEGIGIDSVTEGEIIGQELMDGREVLVMRVSREISPVVVNGRDLFLGLLESPESLARSGMTEKEVRSALAALEQGEVDFSYRLTGMATEREIRFDPRAGVIVDDVAERELTVTFLIIDAGQPLRIAVTMNSTARSHLDRRPVTRIETESGSTVVMEIQNSTFRPQRLTLEGGDSGLVEIRNRDDQAYSLTARGDTFEDREIGPKETVTIDFAPYVPSTVHFFLTVGNARAPGAVTTGALECVGSP